MPKTIDKAIVKTGMAFEKTGLKVIFAFLIDENLIRGTYREIADQTQVALGTVGKIIHDLEAQEFIRNTAANGNRKLDNRQKLIELWTEAYPLKLKTRLKLGTFITDNPSWWKKH